MTGDMLEGDAPKPEKSGWSLFSFARGASKLAATQWQGRVFLREESLGSNHFIAYKFANQNDPDGRRLRLEEERMRQAITFGLKHSPEVLEGVAPLGEVIGPFPKGVNPEYVLKFRTSKESRQYLTLKYTDLPSERRANAFSEFALRGLEDFVVWFKNGYIHTSLSPLTHSEVFEEKWFWNVDPIGEVQDLRESLRYTNLRRTGLDDFEHIRKIDASLNLEFSVGQALVEWMITSAYAGLLNGIKVHKHRETETALDCVLLDGYELFIHSLEGRCDSSGVKRVIDGFVDQFSVEWQKNRLAAPKPDSPKPALSFLIDLTQAFLSDLDSSPHFQRIKTDWLQSSSGYRVDEVSIAQSGNIIRKSWKDRTIQVFENNLQTHRTLELKSAPQAVAIDQENRILVIVDGHLLAYNQDLQMVNEVAGSFQPIMQVVGENQICLVTEAGQIEIYDRNLRRLGQFAVSNRGKIFLARGQENEIVVGACEQGNISGYSLTRGTQIWRFDVGSEFSSLALDSQGRILVGCNRDVIVYDRKGALLAQSSMAESVTSITTDHYGHVLVADKHNDRMLILDSNLGLLSETVGYGHSHKVLIYSDTMELMGELRGVQNPYKILEDSRYKLCVIPRRKNMAIVQYDPGRS